MLDQKRSAPSRPFCQAQKLLDGLIVYGQELGEIGKQLERLLRQRGVRSSLDPVVVVQRWH